MDYEQDIPEERVYQATKIKSDILLYTAAFFVLYSIYTVDSFSTWKFLAVFLPLAVSFIAWKRFTILIPIGFLLWFGVMLMSVGTIYNHDILSLSGPLVCPDGYRAEVATLVQNPVPGETYTSSQMRCVNAAGKVTYPGFSPHFTVLGLYGITAMLLFLINMFFLRLAGTMIKNPYALFLSGSVLYCFLARLIWINRDQIILIVKNYFF